MGPLGDYQDEMERLSSNDANEAAAARLRRALLAPPPPEVAERHLAAMRAAAASHRSDPMEDVMDGQTRNRFATLGLAAALVLGAGIAGALTLPEQAADRAVERTADVQAEPGPGNGGDGGLNSESEHGSTVSAIARDDSTKGCEKGRAVSAVASANSADKRQDDGDHDPCSEGSNGGAASAHAEKGTHGNASEAGDQSSNAGGNAKNEEPHGSGIDSATGRGAGGPTDTPGAPADLPTPGA